MAVSFWLRAGRVPDVLQTWIEEKAITPWSPTNHRVQSLWRALTDDVLTKAEGWKTYEDGVKLRHGFVHKARGVPTEEAERFIVAAEHVVAHIAYVMANVNLNQVAKRSS